MIIGSFVVFDKYNYEMTESVFHLLTLYSLSRLGFPFALLGNAGEFPLHIRKFALDDCC